MNRVNRWGGGKGEWGGGGNGEGMGRGRSVYKQPGTRVDDYRNTQKGGIPSKRDSSTRGTIKGSCQKGLPRGCAMCLVSLTCIYVSCCCVNVANKRMCLGYKQTMCARSKLHAFDFMDPPEW